MLRIISYTYGHQVAGGQACFLEDVFFVHDYPALAAEIAYVSVREGAPVRECGAFVTFELRAALQM